MSDEENELPAGIVELTERSVEARIRDFSEILKDIESLDDKIRQLWREIYENSISDRQNAYVMFAILAKICKDKSTEHAVHSKSICSMIERMQKANEQMIRLAELISRAKHGDGQINPDEMYNQIKGGH